MSNKIAFLWAWVSLTPFFFKFSLPDQSILALNDTSPSLEAGKLRLPDQDKVKQQVHSTTMVQPKVGKVS